MVNAAAINGQSASMKHSAAETGTPAGRAAATRSDLPRGSWIVEDRSG
jgi:hypothetical protein